jgi:hypothetical protein
MRGSGVPEEVDPDTSTAITQALHVMRESPPQPNAFRSRGSSVAASASDSESVLLRGGSSSDSRRSRPKRLTDKRRSTAPADRCVGFVGRLALDATPRGLVPGLMTAADRGIPRTLRPYSRPVQKRSTQRRQACARRVQFGRKEGTARLPRVFRKALDADMAHFLWLANVFL